MEARPPGLVEAIVGGLIPPACREHVMGDLRERYSSVAGYLLDAATVVPHVVASRVRRSFDGGLVLFEYIGLSAIFNNSTAASAVWPKSVPWAPGVPLAVVLGVLILCDAYVPVEPPAVHEPASSLDALFDSSLARAVRHVLLALACAWLAESAVWFWLPASRARASALLEMSGATLLMMVAMRAAWWTMFTPGSRAMRWPAVPRNWAATTNGSGGTRPGFPRWNLGEIVWVLLAAPLVREGWVRLVAARTVIEGLTPAVVLAAAVFVILSAGRGFVAWARAASTIERAETERALLQERVRLLSRWPLRAVLIVGACWGTVAMRVLHGHADPALIGALSALAVHVMGQRMRQNFQQEIDALDQDA